MMQMCVFRELANRIRTWSPRLFAASDDAGEDRTQAEGYVRWLDQLVASMEPVTFAKTSWRPSTTRGGAKHKLLATRGHYDAQFLFHCLIICFDNMHFGGSRAEIRGADVPLKRLMTHALRLLPNIYHQALTESMSLATFPSRSILCRMKFSFDVAWMLLRAERHAFLIAVVSVGYLLVDSSPQGGRNWMLEEAIFVRGDELENAGEAALQLKSFPRTAPFVDEQFENMDILCTAIKGALSRHTFPLTCMAARHADINHKCHCLVHSFRLDNSTWKLVAQFVNIFECVCADRDGESY